MVKNNIEVDVKVKCIEQGKTQAKLAEEIDTTKTYVNRVIKNLHYTALTVLRKREK